MRTFFLSVFGFVIPIGVSLGLSALLFGHEQQSRSSSISHRHSPQPREVGETGRSDELPKDQSTTTIESRENLDPTADQNFLVSFSVRLDTLPANGVRQHLIGKYGFKSPYPGWAVGLRKLSTSVRPEVYWRGRDGSGGWFSFSEIEFVPNEWYSFTLAAKPREFINLYYQRLGAESQAHPIQPVTFAGGYSLTDVSTPRSDEDLRLGIRLPRSVNFPGEVRDVLLSYPKRLPKSFDRFPDFISGGAEAIVRQLKDEEVNLWSSSVAG